ncbi:agip95 [Agrotis ipsilon multiple nucleopolyhedrovirus]|uniref:Telokinin-like peptide n=1 Tax=Agrotis ipsilon multiple nucleopolyhedrovirus TaxID=208013 RepID=B6D609_9ABAC|nr:agip95 [Agrotis ipsilon multiple nucleopolyhedrovirus]ACI28796.1 telokinin-like peptide [Agrotis ipsilon multiple nucleopolyhedrovirus]
MATSNSGTVDISVHVTLDKEADKNVLSFIVREEYHLKKLAVGAYSLNILDTQLLNDLAQRACTTIACGNYVIVYNFTENSNKINVILFNIKPSILKKGNCIFKLIYSDVTTTIVSTNNITTTDKMLDEPVEQQEQHANSQLFKSAFASNRNAISSSDDSSTDSGDDEDATANVGAGATRRTADDNDIGARMLDEMPAKRQKLDGSAEDQV